MRFVNGPIYPCCGPRIDGGVLLTRGSTITYVGPVEAAPRRQDADERVIDLRGRPLLPGLCDAHLHLMLAAVQHAELDCRRAGDGEALQALVRGQALVRPAGSWISGFGWGRSMLPAAARPAALLDAAAPGHPVLLLGKDMHSAWLNTPALERLEAAPALPDRCVVLRAGGHPTGIVHEEVVALRRQLVPERGHAELRADLDRFLHQLHARGITTVHCNEGPAELELVTEHLGRVPPARRVRVLWNLVLDSPQTLLGQRQRWSRAPLPGWLAVGGAKVFVDGTLGSLTAAVSEPYLGTDQRGLLTLSEQELAAWIEAIRAIGTHGVFHCIGDRALEAVLDSLGRRAWPAGTQHRIEHVQLLSARILTRRDLDGLVLSVQPSHMWGDRELAARHLTAAMNRHAYALATMRARGGLLLFGSDAPVEDPDPWRGIQAAVTRLAVGGAAPWNEHERLTLAAALEAHTTNPARVHGDRLSCGALRPGQRADLVVLSEDPFGLPPDALDSVRAELTVVDGEIAYEREGCA